MLTPVLIQIVFWIGSFICVFQGGRIALEGFQEKKVAAEKADTKTRDDMPPGLSKRDEAEIQARDTRGSIQMAAGFALMTFGPLIIRIWCELTIVPFSIHRELKIANDRRR
ncbi:MAG: hypothetical protein K8U57_00365 [Planctomycetes bacterium]|nr:hypothetical protein [Planctomycetota bacterium]